MNIIEALEKVGNAHRYQRAILALLCLYCIVFTYVAHEGNYIFIVPQFRCTSTGSRILEEAEACPIIDQCTISSCSVNVVSAYSITASAKLYCGK